MDEIVAYTYLVDQWLVRPDLLIEDSEHEFRLCYPTYSEAIEGLIKEINLSRNKNKDALTCYIAEITTDVNEICKSIRARANNGRYSKWLITEKIPFKYTEETYGKLAQEKIKTRSE